MNLFVESTGCKCLCVCMYTLYSESTPEGRKITKLDQILLNGNNITMLVPGGEYPSSTIQYMYMCMCMCTCMYLIS